MKTLFNIKPLSANSDPISSFEAAEKNRPTINEQAFKVFKALTEHDGVTSLELSEKSGIDYAVCARRLPDLRRYGAVQNCVHPCGRKVCNVCTLAVCALAMFKNYKGEKRIMWYAKEVE